MYSWRPYGSIRPSSRWFGRGVESALWASVSKRMWVEEEPKARSPSPGSPGPSVSTRFHPKPPPTKKVVKKTRSKRLKWSSKKKWGLSSAAARRSHEGPPRLASPEAHLSAISLSVPFASEWSSPNSKIRVAPAPVAPWELPASVAPWVIDPPDRHQRCRRPPAEHRPPTRKPPSVKPRALRPTPSPPPLTSCTCSRLSRPLTTSTGGRNDEAPARTSRTG